jgi:hypothetical protein
MRKYKSYQPMRGWTNVTMAKTTNRGLIFLTTLALVSALPLMGQQPTATDRVAGGPVAALFDAPSAASERTAPDMAAVPFTPVAVVAVSEAPIERTQHRFWDRENTVLFAAAAGMATADFFTTRANLASGGRELNPLTRVFTGSTPMLATNFALETSAVMGVSYLFHKTGHHTLERLTSIVNIGESAGAVAYGQSHR